MRKEFRASWRGPRFLGRTRVVSGCSVKQVPDNAILEHVALDTPCISTDRTGSQSKSATTSQRRQRRAEL